MEFDKSRVYTAVNADELKIGSKCIFADTIRGLRRKVGEEKDTNCAETFYRLHNDGGDDLFVGNDCAYCYAYLIEPPKEPQYKPFSTLEKAKEIIEKHGGWVFERDSSSFLITGYDIVKPSGCLVYVGNTARSLQYLFEHFILDDGTPCGELAD